MGTVYQFFKHIATNYGTTFAVLFLLIVAILFGVYFLIKTFPDVIRSYVENKILNSKNEHLKGTIKRKNISPAITKILSSLIMESNGSRALLFEFSNGNSNLAGLPFLFINATSESLSIGTSSVGHLYQRVNISLFADFILELEDNNYFFIEDMDNIKIEYPFIHNLFKPADIKSAIFFSIYGVNEKLGFIMLGSDSGVTFNKDEVLPLVVEAAQKISALLNLDNLEETIK